MPRVDAFPGRYRRLPTTGQLAGALALWGSSLLLAPAASAQVGPYVVNAPWKVEPHWADTIDEIFVFERVETQVPDQSARTWLWDSSGRIKLLERESSDPYFSLGYRVVTMDTDADDRLIDGQLNDVGIVATGKLGELVEHWTFHIMGGMGTSNDGHWSNTDALYGLGTLNVSTELTPKSSLHLGVTYDGNGGLLPDIPLPYVTYVHDVSDELDLLIGVRDTAVLFEPIENLTLQLRYNFPADAKAEISYEFVDGLSLFAQYGRTLDGYFLNDRDNTRVFYEHDRVGGGIRWVTQWFDVSLGAGYALNHRFRTGFDLRDLDTRADLDPGLYAYLRVQGTF